MIRRPPRSTRTDPPFPYTTLFRSSWIARQIVLRTIERLLDRLTIDDAMPSIPKVVGRLARAVPALLVGGGIHVVPHLPAEARAVVSAIAGAFVVVAITRAFSAMIDCEIGRSSGRERAGQKV